MLPESPQALVGDGLLTSWAVFVFSKGVPDLVALGTLVLIVLRIVVLWRKLRAE